MIAIQIICIMKKRTERMTRMKRLNTIMMQIVTVFSNGANQICYDN